MKAALIVFAFLLVGALGFREDSAVELVTDSEVEMEVEMQDSGTVEVEAEDMDHSTVGAVADPFSPRTAILDATFMTGHSLRVASDIKLLTAAIDGILTAIKATEAPWLKSKMEPIAGVLNRIKAASGGIKIESQGSCVVVTFESNGQNDVWSSLGLPKWLASKLARVYAVSICKNPKVVRLVIPVQSGEIVKNLNMERGWVLVKLGGSATRPFAVTGRFEVKAQVGGENIKATLTGGFVYPGSFEFSGYVTEGSLSIRTLASAASVTIPSLPSPVEMVVGARIVRVKIAKDGKRPYLALIAESAQDAEIKLGSFKLSKVTIGLVYACPEQDDAFLELDNVYASTDSPLQGRRLYKMVRKVRQNTIARRSFLQQAAAVRETCLTLAATAKVSIGQIDIPFGVSKDSTGTSLTFAGVPYAGSGEFVPDMDMDVGLFKFTVNDLLLTFAGSDSWGSYKSTAEWLESKTKILSTEVEVKKLNARFEAKTSVEFASTVTWNDVKTNVNAFYGPVASGDVVSAVVVDTKLDLITAFSKLFGVSDMPYFTSEGVFFGASTKTLELQGAHSRLAYLVGDRKIKKLSDGITIGTAVKLNPKASSEFVKNLAGIFPGELSLWGTLSSDKFSLTATLERAKINDRLAFIDNSISLEASYVGPKSISLTSTLEMKLGKSDVLKFVADFKAAQALRPTLSVGVSMKSVWNDAFGITGLVIDNPGGSITLQVPDFIPTAFAVHGAIHIKNIISGAVDAQLDLLDPAQDYFYGEVTDVNVCKLYEAFTGSKPSDKVHSSLCETMAGFIASFSLKERELNIQTAKVKKIPAGFMFKGKLPIPNFEVGIEAVVVTKNAPSFNLKIDIPPINFEFFQFVRSEGETSLGAFGEVAVSGSNPLNVELSGFAKIFKTFKGAVKLKLDAKKGFNFESYIGVKLGEMVARVDVSGGLDYKNLLASQGLTVAVKIDNLNSVQEALKSSITTFTKDLKNKAESLRQATAQLSDCNPSKMCSFMCPSSFLETGTVARSGANLALFQRAQLLDQRLLGHVNALARLQRQHQEKLSELLVAEAAGEGTQFIETAKQRMFAESWDIWAAAERDMIDEVEEIVQGVHHWHNIKDLPRFKRVPLENRLAAEHRHAVDEHNARFAEAEMMSMEEAMQHMGWLWEYLPTVVQNAVTALQDQFTAVKDTLCAGAVRLCVGACNTAVNTVAAAGASIASVTELAGDGVDMLASWATAVQFRKIHVSATFAVPPAFSMEVEYKILGDWTTKKFELPTLPFDGKDLSASLLGKLVWGYVSSEELKPKTTPETIKPVNEEVRKEEIKKISSLPPFSPSGPYPFRYQPIGLGGRPLIMSPTVRALYLNQNVMAPYLYSPSYPFMLNSQLRTPISGLGGLGSDFPSIRKLEDRN